jgi:hypothetical protein
MSGLTALDAQFAEGNVPLAVLLGTIDATATVRAVLPDPEEEDAIAARTREEPRTADAFSAMLLGVIALHERLTTLIDPDRPERATEAVLPALPMTGLGR